MESSAHIKCGQGFIVKIEMCRVTNRCVLKILSFKDCLGYQNSLLQIPKYQPGSVSYIFLFLFCILQFFILFFKSMFLEIKKDVYKDIELKQLLITDQVLNGDSKWSKRFSLIVRRRGTVVLKMVLGHLSKSNILDKFCCMGTFYGRVELGESIFWVSVAE